MTQYDLTLTIRLTPTERAELDKLANVERCSRGAILRRALSNVIQSQPAVLFTAEQVEA